MLVDFGLGLDEAVSGKSELGVISGTPAYMAPSRSPASRTASTAVPTSTAWARCSTRCFAAACRSDRDNLRELLRQVRDDEPQPPRQLARDLPQELERACLKALAKKLHDRYTTAADFAEDLRRANPGKLRPRCAIDVDPGSRDVGLRAADGGDGVIPPEQHIANFVPPSCP